MALDVPPEHRERWLGSLAPSDLVYEATLRALLEHGAAAETRDFDDVLPQLPMADAVAASAGLNEPALTPGATVGPYVVEEERGMGTVWRARRSDGVIKRSVAPSAKPI